MSAKNLSVGQKGQFKRVKREFLEKAERELLSLKSEYKESINSMKEQNNRILVALQNSENLIKKYDFLNEDIPDPNGDEGDLISRLEQFDLQVENIAEFHEVSERNKNKINKFDRFIFGELVKKEEGKYHREGGFKNDIIELKSEVEKSFNEIHEKQKKGFHNGFKQIDILSKQVERLLPGASNVALSKAYVDHASSFEKVNRKWSKAFYISIGLLSSVSIIGLFTTETIAEWYKLLPIVGASIWLGAFSAKQRSQNKRLEQEYAYKADVANMYVGVKQEVTQLNNSDEKERLTEILMDLMIAVTSLNPSETLQNKEHDDGGPIMEALKSITNRKMGKATQSK